MSNSLAVRTVDDKRLSLRPPRGFDAEVEPFTGHARWMPRRSSRATSAERWAIELASADALELGAQSVGGKERERFRQNGAEIVVYDCGELPNARWAAWVGPWHMAHAMFYAPMYETHHIAEFFSRPRWSDTPEGLRADAGRAFTLDRSLYMTAAPQVGTLTIEPKRLAGDRVPRHRGFVGNAGELWRVPPTRAQRSLRIMLVTQTAVVTLEPAARSRNQGSALERATDFLAGVEAVEWR